MRRHTFSSNIAFSSASTEIGFFSGITFSSASTEVGDDRNLAERSEHTSGQRHLGVLGPTWALGPSLALLVSWACGSWSSHAHPLVSCFISHTLLVSLNSFVYLRERHISWGFSALGPLRVLASSLGLLVSQFLNRTRTRSSGTSSHSSGSSRSSSSRSSLSRSSFCVCNKATST